MIALMGINGCAFGIADFGMKTACGIFALDSQGNRVINTDAPRMIEIKIGKFSGQQFLFGQAGIVVCAGVAGDATGGAHRFFNGFRRQVGGASRTFALSEINGNA